MKTEDLALWFEQRRDRLDALARRIVGSPADAEDVVQDAWLKATTAHDGSIDSPDAWMTTAVRNLALDRVRRRRIASAFATGADDDRPWHAPSAEDLLMRRLATAALVMRVASTLDRHDAALLLLNVVFDEEPAVLARRTGRTSGAMRVLLHRARRKLAEDGGHEEDPVRERRIEDTFALCWQAVERCDATLLYVAIDEPVTVPATALSSLAPCTFDAAPPVRTTLVRVAGRYVLALRQGDRLICVLPVGVGDAVALA